MLKKKFINRISLVEGLIVLILLIWFFITQDRDQSMNLHFIVSLTFLILLATIFILRSNSHRHMLFAFIFLILSVVADIFRLNNILFLTSSLTLSFFILGVLNMIIFKDKNYNE